MKKPARMDSSLIARKGQATPTPHVDTDDTSAEQSVQARIEMPAAAPTPPLGAIKSLTVKLDAGRYKALRQLGVDEDRTHQDIMVAALDAYMDSHRKQQTPTQLSTYVAA